MLLSYLKKTKDKRVGGRREIKRKMMKFVELRQSRHNDEVEVRL